MQERSLCNDESFEASLEGSEKRREMRRDISFLPTIMGRQKNTSKKQLTTGKRDVNMLKIQNKYGMFLKGVKDEEANNVQSKYEMLKQINTLRENYDNDLQFILPPPVEQFRDINQSSSIQWMTIKKGGVTKKLLKLIQ